MGLGDAASRTAPPLLPSPILNQTDPIINLHYQVERDGNVTSPQAPPIAQRELAQGVYASVYSVEKAVGQLGQLTDLLRGANTPDGVPAKQDAQEESQSANTKPESVPVDHVGVLRRESSGQEIADDYKQRQKLAVRAQARNSVANDSPREIRVEAAKRSASAPSIVTSAAPDASGGVGDASKAKPASETNLEAAGSPQQARSQGNGKDKAGAQSADEEGRARDARSGSDAFADPSVLGAAVVHGPFEPKWIAGKSADPELVFVRTVRVGARELTQGVWFDWPAVRELLLETSRDIFPDAKLVPARDSASDASHPAAYAGAYARLLATIPARVVVPTPGFDAKGSLASPLKSILWAAWLLALFALAGLAWVVWSAANLAERRGRFVTAVTHELRTPLTTFSMYSQMLAEGMVTGDAQRREYAGTLHEQSRRLSGIVESVLEFARLGRGGSSPRGTIPLAALLEKVERTGRSVCEGFGFACAVVVEPSPGGGTEQSGSITTDPSAVERIVANLAENACKYSHGESAQGPGRVEIVWEPHEDTVFIKVRDFGPGVPTGDRARIFRAFERGLAHAHGSVPGLGLGLAVSRGLAEKIGGALTLTGHEGGAEFTLSLPRRSA